MTNDVHISSSSKGNEIRDDVDFVKARNGKRVVLEKFPSIITSEYDLSGVPVGTKSVVFPTFGNDFHLRSLLTLPITIEQMYLGHDGMIFGSEEDLQAVLDHLPNLKRYEYCGDLVEEEYEGEYGDDTMPVDRVGKVLFYRIM